MRLPAATVTRLAEERVAAELAPLRRLGTEELDPASAAPLPGERELLRAIDAADRQDMRNELH